MRKHTPRLEVYAAASDAWPIPTRWYWRLTGGNGEIQCPGEGYTRKQDAVRGAEAAQRNMALATIVFLD